jgi:hypothetical protein
LKFLRVAVEPVEALRPELLETTDPLVDRPQPSSVERVEALLAGLPDLDEAHLA